MASYLSLFLDLEANGEIFMPQYVTTESLTHIRIVSDSPLTEIYNIKFVDSLGIEHSLPPQYPNSNEYEFEITFTDYPYGVTNLFVSIADSVGNRADLAPRTFEVYKASVLFVTVSDSQEYGVNLYDGKDYDVKQSDSKSFTVLLSNEGSGR